MANGSNQPKISLNVESMRRLIANKSKEIEGLEKRLRSKREEKVALEAFTHHLLNPQLHFDWDGFLKQLSAKNPELVDKLTISEVNAFDVGKLRITAPRYDATLIRLYLPVLRTELFEFTGTSYHVEIRDSENSSG